MGVESINSINQRSILSKPPLCPLLSGISSSSMHSQSMLGWVLGTGGMRGRSALRAGSAARATITHGAYGKKSLPSICALASSNHTLMSPHHTSSSYIFSACVFSRQRQARQHGTKVLHHRSALRSSCPNPAQHFHIPPHTHTYTYSAPLLPCPLPPVSFPCVHRQR